MVLKGGPLRSQVIGSWSIQDGLKVNQKNMFERRKDLSGVTVINTVLPWVPISVIEEDDVNGMSQSGIIHSCHTMYIEKVALCNVSNGKRLL